MLHRLYSLLLFVLFLIAMPCTAQQSKVKVKPRTTTTKKKTTNTQHSSNRAASSVVSTSQCVDLGLSVKWAGYNVGATHPEEFGNYYAWGEISTKTDYLESTYKYYNTSGYVNIGNSISGNSSYDVARAKWGYPWRMPTIQEIEEIRKRCTWTWVTYRGINGYKVTGPNGNAIFLPAAGYRYGSVIGDDNEYGYYWSGTMDSSYMDGAQCINFRSYGLGIGSLARVDGQSVRPVSD